MKVLVTGFGAFPGVPVNPTAAIARAVDGARLGPVEVMGIVLPVSYQRAPELTIERTVPDSSWIEAGSKSVVGGQVFASSPNAASQRSLRQLEARAEGAGQTTAPTGPPKPWLERSRPRTGSSFVVPGSSPSLYVVASVRETQPIGPRDSDYLVRKADDFFIRGRTVVSRLLHEAQPCFRRPRGRPRAARDRWGLPLVGVRLRAAAFP